MDALAANVASNGEQEDTFLSRLQRIFATSKCPWYDIYAHKLKKWQPKIGPNSHTTNGALKSDCRWKLNTALRII